MKKAIFSYGLIMSICLALSIQVQSATPKLISYQGFVTDSTGTPIDGPADIVEFTIYDADSAGNAIWSEEHTSIVFTDGLFSVLLGSVSELVDSVFNDTSRFLGISLDGGVSEITPRTRLVSSPYSFRVSTIDGAGGGVVSGDVSIQSNLAVDGEIDATGAENKIRFFYNALGDLPSAATYHGMFAHVHLEGKAYYSHAGNWVPLANEVHDHGWQDNGNTIELSTTTDSVGIGTSSPTERLEVNGIIYSSSGGIKFPDATIQTTAATGGGSGGWTDDGTVVRLSTSTDSVGIGTSSPSEMLDVNGNLSVTGKATIGSGHVNSGANSFVAGDTNTASGDNSTVSGGKRNISSGNYSVVGGGTQHIASGDWSTVGGGELDSASGPAATVAGGSNNVASGNSSSVGGGYQNSARNLAATIAGGYQGRAWGDYASVLGGLSNWATGAYAVALGGRFARADSAFSLAFGWRAHAQHRGAMVFADTSSSVDFLSSAANEFSVRAAGGTRIFSNPTLSAGVILAAGSGTWASVSDSTIKRNIRPVNEFEILEKVSNLPISRWSYETQSEDIEHIGPMAQDFYAAFGLGDDNRRISTIDPDGISLAAIQALYLENRELKESLARLQSNLEILNEKVKRIENKSESN